MAMELMLFPGVPQIGELVKLNASPLNSNLFDSLRRKDRKIDKSKLALPSPRKTLRPKLPNVWDRGIPKAPPVPQAPEMSLPDESTGGGALLNHCAGVGLPKVGLPHKKARSVTPVVPTFGMLLDATTLKSVPEVKLEIPFSCQPPITASTPLLPLCHFLPAPKGSSYTKLAVRICGRSNPARPLSF